MKKNTLKQIIKELETRNSNLRATLEAWTETTERAKKEWSLNLVMNELNNPGYSDDYKLNVVRGALRMTPLAEVLVQSKQFTQWVRDNKKLGDIYLTTMEELKEKVTKLETKIKREREWGNQQYEAKIEAQDERDLLQAKLEAMEEEETEEFKYERVTSYSDLHSYLLKCATSYMRNR